MRAVGNYIRDFIRESARDIWDVRYPAGLLAGTAFFLIGDSVLTDYRHKARISSNIETIRRCADTSGDGYLNSNEKMGVLLRAFPRADKDIQDQLKVSMRSLAEAGKREGVHPFDVYSDILDREFEALLGNCRSELFPVSQKEREALLELVASMYSRGEQEHQ